MQCAMVPTLLLLLFSLTLVQPSNGKCDLFTTKDVEGPFFEVRKLLILALKKSFEQPNAPKYYELAPRNELNDRSQAVILEGQVSENLGLLGKVFLF